MNEQITFHRYLKLKMSKTHHPPSKENSSLPCSVFTVSVNILINHPISAATNWMYQLLLLPLPPLTLLSNQSLHTIYFASGIPSASIPFPFPRYRGSNLCLLAYPS